MTSNELRTTRKGLNLTQAQMGRLMGMKQQAYGAIETKRQPTFIHTAVVKLIMVIDRAGLLYKLL